MSSVSPSHHTVPHVILIHPASPAGQTCGEYAGAFAQAVGGYINNPDVAGDCQFCQYSVGDSFYRNLNITYDTRWRDFGIFVRLLLFSLRDHH
jgi:ATP-binding cassette subfamily G (WHITE) protein 2 (SNQ2)